MYFASKKNTLLQCGGPDGKPGASLRYLSQRYTMPYPELKTTLTDIGTEKLGYLEMVGIIVHQPTRNLIPEQIREAGFNSYFVDHTTGIYPVSISGVPYPASTLVLKDDPVTNLREDLVAGQRARTTYDSTLRLCDDPDIIGPI